MDWIRYANQGATRNLPLDPQLAGALDFLPELGLTMEVFSGGQPAKGSGRPRVGSTRHDHGKAADVFFYKDGRRLDWSNPDDIPTYQEIVRRGRAKGLTGFGAGPNYMQPGSMHIGFGNEAVWGAGGKGENAPGWLQEAFSGAPAPRTQPRGLLASAGGNTTMAGGQGADTMQAPQQAPQMAPKPRRASLFGRLEGVPFFGGLADPDKRARLAMGLEGMTLNPNQALMANYQGEIDQRAEEDDRNRSAEFLMNQPGAETFAEAVRSGTLTAAEAYALYYQSIQEPEPLKPTTAIQEYEYALSRGYEGSFEQFKREGSGPLVENTVGGEAPPDRFIYGSDAGLPAGWRIDRTTGEASPIPGGPNDTSGEQATAAMSAQDSIELVDAVLNDPNLGAVTGMIEGRLPARNQAQQDLKVRIEQLQGQAFLQAFETLKGGGQITEREGQAAQAAIARLQTVQSEEAYRSALTELRSIMQRGLERAQAGGADPEPATPGLLPPELDFSTMSDAELQKYLEEN